MKQNRKCEMENRKCEMENTKYEMENRIRKDIKLQIRRTLRGIKKKKKYPARFSKRNSRKQK